MAAWLSPSAGAAVAAALLAARAGCASGPAPPTGAALARQQHALAVARAAEYCRSRGLVMRTRPSDAPTRAGQVASDLHFRCVQDR
jgi:hypothetical protein